MFRQEFFALLSDNKLNMINCCIKCCFFREKNDDNEEDYPQKDLEKIDHNSNSSLAELSFKVSAKRHFRIRIEPTSLMNYFRNPKQQIDIKKELRSDSKLLKEQKARKRAQFRLQLKIILKVIRKSQEHINPNS